jgi:hypothetical protein
MAAADMGELLDYAYQLAGLYADCAARHDKLSEAVK